MHDYMKELKLVTKELKLVTLKLSRNMVCKLLIGLDVLANDAEVSEVYRAIHCIIKAQLDEHDAKEASKHDS